MPSSALSGCCTEARPKGPGGKQAKQLKGGCSVIGQSDSGSHVAVAAETLPFSQHSLCHRMTAGLPRAFTEPQGLGPHVHGGLSFSCLACVAQILIPSPTVFHTSTPSLNVLSSSSSVALLVPQALPDPRAGCGWPVLVGCHYLLEHPFVLTCCLWSSKRPGYACG